MSVDAWAVFVVFVVGLVAMRPLVRVSGPIVTRWGRAVFWRDVEAEFQAARAETAEAERKAEEWQTGLCALEDSWKEENRMRQAAELERDVFKADATDWKRSADEVAEDRLALADAVMRACGRHGWPGGWGPGVRETVAEHVRSLRAEVDRAAAARAGLVAGCAPLTPAEREAVREVVPALSPSEWAKETAAIRDLQSRLRRKEVAMQDLTNEVLAAQGRQASVEGRLARKHAALLRIVGLLDGGPVSSVPLHDAAVEGRDA